MKKLVFLVLLGISWNLQAQKEPKKVKGGYEVDIQTSAICDMCKEAIEYDLTFEKGVKSVVLILENKVVTVLYNPKKTDANNIRKRITMVGYNADKMVRDSIAYENLPMCCKDGAHADEDFH
jgi:copper chaperone CopZ